MKNPKNLTELCWGRQPVMTLLEEDPSRCLKVLLSDSCNRTFAGRVEALVMDLDIPLEKVNNKVLEKLVEGENHQGIIAKIKSFEPLDLKDFLNGLEPDRPCLVIILDHIQDPHNMGAIIRTSEASGASGVIYPTRRASSPTGTVIKVSAGSALRVPLIGVVNIARTISDLQKAGFWVIGLDHNSKDPIWLNDMPARLGLVVGAEGEGLSRLVAERCDELRKIPMMGHAASLNASVAAALGMYEWTRNFIEK